MDSEWIEQYKKTKEYHIIYGMLIEAARLRGTVTYQEIAEVMGLPPSGSHMGREVGAMIGAISAEEISYGRPMLSAIVVGVSGKPGAGLYWYARELGALETAEPDEDTEWWQAEMKRVYETWQKSYK